MTLLNNLITKHAVASHLDDKLGKVYVTQGVMKATGDWDSIVNGVLDDHRTIDAIRKQHKRVSERYKTELEPFTATVQKPGDCLTFRGTARFLCLAATGPWGDRLRMICADIATLAVTDEATSNPKRAPASNAADFDISSSLIVYERQRTLSLETRGFAVDAMNATVAVAEANERSAKALSDARTIMDDLEARYGKGSEAMRGIDKLCVSLRETKEVKADFTLSIEHAFDSLRTGVVALRGDITDMRGDITGAQTDAVAVRDTVSGFRGDIAEARSDLVESQTVMATTHAKSHEFRVELDAARESLKKDARTVDRLKDDVVTMETDKRTTLTQQEKTANTVYNLEASTIERKKAAVEESLRVETKRLAIGRDHQRLVTEDRVKEIEAATKRITDQAVAKLQTTCSWGESRSTAPEDYILHVGTQADWDSLTDEDKQTARKGARELSEKLPKTTEARRKDLVENQALGRPSSYRNPRNGAVWACHRPYDYIIRPGGCEEFAALPQEKQWKLVDAEEAWARSTYGEDALDDSKWPKFWQPTKRNDPKLMDFNRALGGEDEVWSRQWPMWPQNIVGDHTPTDFLNATGTAPCELHKLAARRRLLVGAYRHGCHENFPPKKVEAPLDPEDANWPNDPAIMSISFEERQAVIGDTKKERDEARAKATEARKKKWGYSFYQMERGGKFMHIEDRNDMTWQERVQLERDLPMWPIDINIIDLSDDEYLAVFGRGAEMHAARERVLVARLDKDAYAKLREGRPARTKARVDAEAQRMRELVEEEERQKEEAEQRAKEWREQDLLRSMLPRSQRK